MANETAAFNAYNNLLKQTQEQSKQFVERSLTSYIATHPEASPQELKDAGIKIMGYAYSYYGDIGAAAAAKQYDAMAQEHGFDVDAAQMFTGSDDVFIDSTWDEYASLLYQGKVQEFVQKLGGTAYDKPKRAANNAMYRNATRYKDRRAGVRYARVPTGRETCGFCLMLASRGFSYKSRATAGETFGNFNRYHSHCDCTVWASTDAAKIQGYDPDFYYAVYADCRDTIGTTERNAVAKEIERRSREWVWFGRVPEVKVSTSATEKDLAIAKGLANHGFAVELKNSRMSAQDVVFRIGGRIYEQPEQDIKDLASLEDWLYDNAQASVVDVSNIDHEKGIRGIAEAINTDMLAAPEVLLIDGPRQIRRLTKEPKDK